MKSRLAGRVALIVVYIVMVNSMYCVEHARAGDAVDIVAWFDKAKATHGAGMARKTMPVDVRAAKPGEIVVTMVGGEKETQSPPAEAGDMVVRNRCPETGNEEILVKAAKFAERYEGPLGESEGWSIYRPRGNDMRFVMVAEEDGEFSFTAPWGEPMIARFGDAIVQDPANPRDTYRIAGAAFACTYDVIEDPMP